MKALFALLFAVSLVVTPQTGFALYSLSCDLSQPESETTPQPEITYSAIDSSSEWNQLADELLHKLGGDDLRAFFGVSPRVTFSAAVFPNAYALETEEVIVSSGLLANISSSTEFAFVLAHEIGHMVLGHTHREEQKLSSAARLSTHIKEEIEADRFALQLMQSAGLDAAEILPFLSRLQSFGRHRGAEIGELFPSMKHRITALSDLQLQRSS